MTETANFINQQLFLKETQSPVEDDIVIINKLAAFSDDDSACSFESEEDEKLFTPPLPAEIDVDWGKSNKNT